MVSTQITDVKLRRPLDDDNPNGYLESDRDWVLNNLDLCVSLLNKAVIELADKEIIP